MPKDQKPLVVKETPRPIPKANPAGAPSAPLISWANPTKPPIAFAQPTPLQALLHVPSPPASPVIWLCSPVPLHLWLQQLPTQPQ
ncbi:hypothetical protein RHS01_04257 [Rhizoctonia solani]|uniref:Uncharacterized protein n=1 Tax=Rhizoctonia solani TaxID=456999 RepID=A0A8H7M1M6_9AGAM|nr:hypothetical protein RHS01_11280 [Rhizoctonia solani]KAF8756458.1 hypothetical protein RHS01_04257 [Rhizoctonia solani]